MLSSTLLFMSAPDITIILIVALVFFGGKKLPELARGLGQGIKEFKDATNGEAQPPAQTPPPPPAAPTPPVSAAPPVAEHKPTLDLSKPGDTQPPAQQ